MTQPLSRARMLALTGAGLLGTAVPPRLARAGAGATTFPFDYVNRQIRFAATLDGRGPLTFALDSGAGGNVIFTGAAQRIGLTGGRRVNVTGASGDVKARLAHVDKLVAGPLTLENQGVVVLDLAAGEAIGLDGIVGWELLRGLRRPSTSMRARSRSGPMHPTPCNSATPYRSRSATTCRTSRQR